MNIAFIMDHWSYLKPDSDSTLVLIHEALLRNHNVGILNPENLTIRDSVTTGFFDIVADFEKLPDNTTDLHKKIKFNRKMLPLAGFDVIFMRADPPIDNIVLNFLDSVKNETFILNDIDGLREANNKIYTAAFYDPNNEMIPATYVSRNKEYIKEIIRKSKKDKMIMKPLNGFGGSGVIVIEKNAMLNINSLLDFYISDDNKNNYVILQEYVDGAEKGDVRVLLLNGEPIGALRRVPAIDDPRSNVSAGGKIEKHTLTKKELELSRVIGAQLVKSGLYLAGLDIINNKLIEVNVTSPGGISHINLLNKSKLQEQILDFAEGIVFQKERAIDKKFELRKIFSDAKNEK